MATLFTNACRTCGIALCFFLWSSTSSAQSRQTLDAVRLNQSNALALATVDAVECAAQHCPNAARISLLLGYLELAAGDLPSALKHFSGPAPAGPLEPFFQYYRGETLFYLRQPKLAADAFRLALQKGPKSLLARAKARAGEALWAAGDAPAALPLLEQAANELASPELLEERAEVRSALGNLDGALSDWKTLAVRYPNHPYGQTGLAQLESRKPDPLNADERVTRAASLLDSNPAQAWEELQQARRLPHGDATHVRLALLEIRTLYALGRTQEAQKASRVALRGSLELASESALLTARTELRGNDNRKALSRMAEVSRRYRNTPAGEEASFYVGWLLLQNKKEKAAVRAFDQFLARYRHSSRWDEVYWLKSLCLIRLSQYQKAQRSLQGLLKVHPQTRLLPQVLYWTVRVQQLAGTHPSILAPRFAQLVSQFPSSYYAWLSLTRLELMQRTPPQLFPKAALALKASMPPPLGTAVALAQAGLYKDARDETRQILFTVQKPDEAMVYGAALQQLGAFGHSFALATRALWGRGYTDRNPTALALLYPRPYENEVRSQAERVKVDPYLVWSIMRRESGFREDVISLANARGLMQLVPPTAKAVARELHLPEPAPDALFSPGLNIELGSWYIGQLWKRFHHPALVAAAYNAGPPQLLKWLEQRGNLPLDLFVELLPFRETRGYVKQILANDCVYHLLYDREPLADPSLILPTAAKDGVGF